MSLLLRQSVTLAQTKTKPANHVYVVMDQLGLAEVSILLYGTTKEWPKIARWNHLSPPYRLKIGRKLRLMRPPTLPPEVGRAKLLSMWRKRLGVEVPATGAPSSETAPEKHDVALERELSREFQARVESIKKDEEAETTTDEVKASQLLEEGEQAFKKNDLELALARFQESRKLNRETLRAWIGEIHTLRLLKHDDEARKTASILVKEKPEYRELPMIEAILGPP